MREHARRLRWTLRRATSELSPGDLEDFHRLPDVHNVVRNGPERLDVVAEVVAGHAPAGASLLDLGCYEGYLLAHVIRRTESRAATGVDAATVVLERAREVCRGLPVDFRACDLGELYRTGERPSGFPEPHDVVLLAEVLYYLGPRAHWTWAHPSRDFELKLRFLRSAASLARTVLVVQHFGSRERAAIEAVVRECGGVEADSRWGAWVVPGTAPRETARPG